MLAISSKGWCRPRQRVHGDFFVVLEADVPARNLRYCALPQAKIQAAMRDRRHLGSRIPCSLAVCFVRVQASRLYLGFQASPSLKSFVFAWRKLP